MNKRISNLGRALMGLRNARSEDSKKLLLMLESFSGTNKHLRITFIGKLQGNITEHCSDHLMSFFLLNKHSLM